MTTQLTRNFWRHEMACHCGCGFDTMDYETLQLAQIVCDHFARQFQIPKVICTVTSAARCASHNKAVGGSPNSQHLYGRAMDIRIVGVPPQEVYDYLNVLYPDSYGFGLYTSFVHIDTRTGTPARW